MSERSNRNNVFPRRLDRAAMLSYWVGAVVPLIALGMALRAFVLGHIDDSQVRLAVVCGFAAVASLSLLGFIGLRRFTARLLRDISDDNTRQCQLLGVSRNLTAAEHRDDVLRTALRCARELCGAEAAWMLARPKTETESGPDTPWELHETSGERASELAHAVLRAVPDLASTALAEGDFCGHVILDSGARAGAYLIFGVGIARAESEPRVLCVARKLTSRQLDTRCRSALATLGGLVAIAATNAELHEAQRNFFTHVTELLCLALDSHLDRMAGHSQRVTHYANCIGRRMELGERELGRLHFAALLHDIGMLRIERSAQRSQRACRDHALLGGRMLARIRLWEDIAPIVLHHHERIDGRGYPHGLTGDDIPLLSRILSVADAFDVMTSRTSYRDRLSPDQALAELEACAGSQFDRDVVAHCVALIREGAIP